MELYLQFAYGMKQISIDLSNDWNGATVILSPRDITPKQLENWRPAFEKANIKSLFDPQCYYPKSNHKILTQYEYWDNSFSTKLSSNKPFEYELIENILYYNNLIGTKDFIIPAAMLQYDESWLKRCSSNSYKLINATKKVVSSKNHILTLALPENLLLQKEYEIEKLLEVTEKFDVDGYYIIATPPQEKYLVDTPIWLSNLLQLCAGLKLQNKKVIMGYANHQLLCLSAAKIDAIATGTYLNVRRFTNKFEKNEGIKRKSTWYYYPPALSEYKIGFLDVAFNANILNIMKPPVNMDNGYTHILFSGAMPSSTAFNETLAFKHYLNCMRIQAKNLTKSSFKETLNANEMLLTRAMRRIEQMESNGVYAQSRSFKDMVDINLSALQRLNTNRGFPLKMEWKNL